METIAIANQKGGCGKTTTAINLSAALARKGKRVILIDLDPQAHASFGLGVSASSETGSVYNILTLHPGKRRPFASCLRNISPNFDLLPADIHLSTLEQELKDREDAISELSRVVCSISDAYEYIIVDSPPSLGFLTFNALRAADRVIVPIDMSAFSLMGVGKLLGMLELIKNKTRHAPRVNALATLFDKRTKYSQSIAEDIRHFFKNQMLQTVVRVNVTLKQAVSKGVSVLDFDRMSNGAMDYTALADEVLHLRDSAEEEELDSSWGGSEDLEKLESALPARGSIQKTSEPDSREVMFRIDFPEGKDIHVVGEFNDWRVSDETRLVRSEKGAWEKRMTLPRGIYRYKFFADGKWLLDPQNQEREPNSFGTFDSLIRI